MNTITLPAASVEFLSVEVVAVTDPSAASVDFGVGTSDDAPTSWVAGSWTGAAVLRPDGLYSRRARVLVGSAPGLVLAAGRWLLWARVSSSPEAVVRQVGYLVLT